MMPSFKTFRMNSHNVFVCTKCAFSPGDRWAASEDCPECKKVWMLERQTQLLEQQTRQAKYSGSDADDGSSSKGMGFVALLMMMFLCMIPWVLILPKSMYGVGVFFGAGTLLAIGLVFPKWKMESADKWKFWVIVAVLAIGSFL
jgi:hypothetical protein